MTSIGSDASSDLRLEGLDGAQAEIRRDEHDKYSFVSLSTTVPNAVNGAHVEHQVLRTGSRIQLGTGMVTYFREEFADHGRPCGGRLGGELSDQERQPTPNYRRTRRPA